MQKLIHRLRKSPITSQKASSRFSLEVEQYDVTSFSRSFDPKGLSILDTAPAWLTPAERLLLYTLAYTFRPHAYLEIGTLNGGSALIVCSALDALRAESTMICVDPEPKIADHDWQALKHRVRLLQATSPDILPEARRLAERDFELVLIDGDHSYKGVLRDGRGVLPYCQAGALILFHDCFNPDIQRALDDLCESEIDTLFDFGPLTHEITMMEDGEHETRWGGIRVFQVRS